MQRHLLWVVFLTYFTFFNKCETVPAQTENDVPYALSQLFESQDKHPIIVYFQPRSNFETDENLDYLRDTQLDDEREDNDEDYLRTTQSDERAYLLYHLLRTAVEEENIDPTAAQKLQPAKEFLRKALIGRCRKLNNCMKKCPQKKLKYTCNVQCKQIFDDLDECDEPKENKCHKPKCGNTMPPSWLL